MTEQQPHLFVPCRNNEHPLCPHGAGYGADGEPSIVCQCACHFVRTIVLHDAEALDMLISVYMDGLMSGAASAAQTIANAPDELADKFATQFAQSMRRDPAAMLMVETEVKERLAGIDTGSKQLSIKHNAPEAGGSK